MITMPNDKRNRIFWLGMHVVLTKTELPRLRALGYEVFNPPYLANVYDQSAVVDWDNQQPTTLPPEVFRELSQYNFFYNRITPRIAELLNEYFGTVVVTISPAWLDSVLDAYHGRIIYRVFGQLGTISESLWQMRLFRTIQEHDNFVFVPHAEEAVRDEHSWLKSRMTVVPYTLPLDVFEHENTWRPEERHAREIMTCCPNIDNAYYANYYNYLNTHFAEPYFKLYGVQPREYDDPRVVGTLAREEQLRRYRRAQGFWYHYDTTNVCYLPPVEMMTIGGPVVYMRGSLLSRYFDEPGPGEVTNVDDAKRKIRMLLAGDRAYIDELRQAQQPVARRYHPDHVHPIFDSAMKRLIDRPEVKRQQPAVLRIEEPADPGKRLYVFFHAPAQQVKFEEGRYEACGDVAPAVRKAVHQLLANTDHEVVVTCFAEQLECAMGYLQAEQTPGRLKFLVLDARQLAPDGLQALKAAVREVRSTLLDNQDQTARRTAGAPLPAFDSSPATASQSQKQHRILHLGMRIATICGKNRIAFGAMLFSARGAIRTLRFARSIRNHLRAQKARLRSLLGRCWRAIRSEDPWISRRECANRINADLSNVIVIVPHAQLYPEAILLDKPMIICADEPGCGAKSAPANRLRQKMHAMTIRCLTEKAAAIANIDELCRCELIADQPLNVFQLHRASSLRAADATSSLGEHSSARAAAVASRKCS